LVGFCSRPISDKIFLTLSSFGGSGRTIDSTALGITGGVSGSTTAGCSTTGAGSSETTTGAEILTAGAGAS